MYEFDTIASYYDAMYSDRIEDVGFYLNVVKEIGSPVLECGCGTGRVLIPIAESGQEIWGIDGSKAMLNIAKGKLQNLKSAVQKNVHLSHQDMREFHLERSFALCIVPFRAFLHLLTISDQDKALDQIHKHLRRRGKLVLDIFAPSYELLAQGTTNLHLEQKLNPETNNKITIKDQVRYEHAKQIIHVERCYEEREKNGQVHRKMMPFTLRYIFRYEMQAILEKNEFQLKEVYGGFDKRPYDYQSGEMIFVAEKVG